MARHNRCVLVQGPIRVLGLTDGQTDIRAPPNFHQSSHTCISNSNALKTCYFHNFKRGRKDLRIGLQIDGWENLVV